MDKIEIFSNKWGAFTVASRGASLLSLQIGGGELLHDFGDQWQQWAAGAVMFPFPVRMASGTVMAFEAAEYHWPINDAKHRAALHGFTPWGEFELAQLPSGIQASWNYDGSKEHYPFPCRLTISYTLDEHGLTLSGRIENLGKSNIPFHMGWHPYFKTNAPALHPVPTHRLKKNEVSHPGEKIPFKGFDWTEEVDGAFFMESVELGDISIQPLSAITQVFRPANAPFVAIEPITGLCHPDFPWRTVPPGEADEVVTIIGLKRR
jgi:galactose mutarotase-like enzyme